MSDRSALQASRYQYPYHWLTEFGSDRNVWSINQELRWGLEHLGLLETVIQEVTGLSPASVLDVGCGDGRLLYELRTRGVAKLIGVDLNPRAVAFARAFLEDENMVYSAPVSEAPDGPFDVITLIEVLEHVPEAEIPSLMQEVLHRLAPDGRLVVSVPTTNVPVIPKHERHYSATTIREHLGPDVIVESERWLHRVSRAADLTRMLMTNRFVAINWPPARRLVTRAYRRYILPATPENGAHMLTLARRR